MRLTGPRPGLMRAVGTGLPLADEAPSPPEVQQILECHTRKM